MFLKQRSISTLFLLFQHVVRSHFIFLVLFFHLLQCILGWRHVTMATVELDFQRLVWFLLKINLLLKLHEKNVGDGNVNNIKSISTNYLVHKEYQGLKPKIFLLKIMIILRCLIFINWNKSWSLHPNWVSLSPGHFRTLAFWGHQSA